MGRLNIISLLLLILLCSCSPSSNHRDSFNRFHESEKDKFFADPLVFYNADSTKPRLDLTIELPIENISFQKDYNNQIYYSKIIITVNIKNSNNETILTKTYTESSSYSYKDIKVKSKESQFYFYNYNIEQGKYKIEVVLKDNYSNNEFKKSYDVSVNDFKSRDIVFSDIMFLSKVNINQDGTKEITPLISNNAFGLKELFAFFEIYNNTGKEISKEYIFRLKDNEDLIVKEYTLPYVLTPDKNQMFESIFFLKELKKYIPEEPSFEYYQQDNEQKLFFVLEISDKANNELAARKKLLFFPDKLRNFMLNRPPPTR